jgi:hypothetical protein
MPYGFRAGEADDPTTIDGIDVWTDGTAERAAVGTWLTGSVVAAGGEIAAEVPQPASTNNNEVPTKATRFISVTPSEGR